MAIRIDIPQIGTVEVEGAASEETLQRIAAALDKANTSTASSAGSANKATKDLAKEALGAAKGIKGVSTSAVAMAMAADNAMQSLKNFGTTAAAVTAKFLTDYAKIADEPIKTGRDLLNTGIDLVADFGGGLAKSIPVFGPFIGGVIDATAALAKLANNMFADQLEKNVKALQTYAKSGVSFAGGMQQMQNLAKDAGLGIKDFSEIVSKNKLELNKLGLAGGEAAERLAKGMGAAVTTIGKSGQNLRTELFKLGYQYDEQGEIFTAFMAQQQAAGKLRAMSDVEIAKGTREYATNLKVISDLTGQDAKKLMERANAEMLRGSLQNKLVGEQKTAFASASSLLSAKSKAAGDALTQYLSLGAITDPAVAANKELAGMVRAIGDQVKAGNTNITSYTQEQMALATERITTSGANLADATDKALVAGVSGAGSKMAQVSNEFVQAMGSATPDPKAAEKSASAAEDQAGKINKLGDTTAKLYDATKAQQVLLESKLNPNLETYVGLIEKANKAAIGTVNKILNPMGGGLPPPPQTEEEARQRFIEQGGKKGGIYWYKGVPKNLAGGGDIPAGQAAIAGEAGPELISGPASVLSKASTEKLIVALDAMKEKVGHRFDDNDFQPMVGTTPARKAIIKERMSGFESFTPQQLQEEMSKRSEYADMDRAMKRAAAAMDDEMGMGKSETTELLREVVKVMKDNNSLTSGILQASM